MPKTKNKRPAPRKPNHPPADKEESLSQELCSLALAQDDELRHAVRRALRQGRAAVRYGAPALARGARLDPHRHRRAVVHGESEARTRAVVDLDDRLGELALAAAP